MDSMMKIRDSLCTELDNIATKKLTADGITMIDKITHSIKSIDTIMAMENANYGGGYQGARYPMPPMQDMGGYSYGRNQDRDSMGRYTTRMGGNGYSQNGNYQGNYYGTSGDFHSKISEMMAQTNDPKEREVLQRLMNNM